MFLAYRGIRVVRKQEGHMKLLASILGAIATIATIGCATLWTSLRTERQTNIELHARVADAGLARLASAAPAPAPPTATPVAAATVASADAPTCKPETPSPRPAQAVSSTFERSIDLQRELFKDPEYRKLRTAQNRMNIERNYEGLAEELGLSANDADRLFDLLAEQQTAQTAEDRPISATDAQDQAARAEVMRRREALQREQEEALRAMLGSKVTQFQEFQQTRPARNQVRNLGTQLAQAGVPLTQAQSRSLTAVMIAEQQRQMQETRTMPRSVPVNAADPDYRARSLEESLKRTEENNRRLLEAVAPHMTAKQLATYREQMELQAASNRASTQLQIRQQRLQSQLQQK
jgi:hypothetical protein